MLHYVGYGFQPQTELSEGIMPHVVGQQGDAAGLVELGTGARPPVTQVACLAYPSHSGGGLVGGKPHADAVTRAPLRPLKAWQKGVQWLASELRSKEVLGAPQPPTTRAGAKPQPCTWYCPIIATDPCTYQYTSPLEATQQLFGESSWAEAVAPSK